MSRRARWLVLGVMWVMLGSLAHAESAATKDAGKDPRRHHYYFAHRLLRQVYFEHFDAFYPRVAQDPAGELAGLWQHVANGLNPRERLAPDGLGEATRFNRDGREIVIIALPEARAPAEAVFVILVTSEREHAYLTYEKTVSFVGTEEVAVLCGWSAEGKHMNFGLRGSPDRAGLDEVLAKYFARKPAASRSVPNSPKRAESKP